MRNPSTGKSGLVPAAYVKRSTREEKMEVQDQPETQSEEVRKQQIVVTSCNAFVFARFFVLHQNCCATVVVLSSFISH